jgi:hypothetical protein
MQTCSPAEFFTVIFQVLLQWGSWHSNSTVDLKTVTFM